MAVKLTDIANAAGRTPSTALSQARRVGAEPQGRRQGYSSADAAGALVAFGLQETRGFDGDTAARIGRAARAEVARLTADDDAVAYACVRDGAVTIARTSKDALAEVDAGATVLDLRGPIEDAARALAMARDVRRAAKATKQ